MKTFLFCLWFAACMFCLWAGILSCIATYGDLGGAPGKLHRTTVIFTFDKE